MTTFDALEKKAFWKTYGKNLWQKLVGNLWEKKKMLVNQHFLFFPTMFSALWKTILMFWVTFNLSSASTSNLDKPKILSFGKELINENQPVSFKPFYSFRDKLSNLFDLLSATTCFYAPVSKDRGAYCFTVVHLSVCTNLMWKLNIFPLLLN